MPTDAPIARLLTNVSEYVKRNPRDPNGYYTLGRIHYFAFAAPARKTMPVTRYSAASEQDSLPSAVPFGNPGRVPDPARKSEGGTLSPKQRTNHVQAAIRNLKQAIALEKRPNPSGEFARKGLSELTLACVYEEGRSDAAKSWREEAIRFYRLAYQKSVQDETQKPTAPIFGVATLVSHEAANSYLRLVKQRGISPGEKQMVAQVEQTVQQLKRLPPSNVVTPIIFALDRVRPLSSLVAPHPQGVTFDLDGSARSGQRYSTWPRADTGILVWDPTHTGHITSGRQLFGNATWWIFWENGYRALQSLDDNHDGWLIASELQNLGVWVDRNSNGNCESGEVRSLAETGIAGLNVQDAQPTRTGWACQNGIRLQDGTLLPTFDWIAKPHRD